MDQITVHVCVKEMAAEIAAQPAERKPGSGVKKDAPLNARGENRSLQESLDHLRLSIKYLLFDLEATRRENEYLRNMIRLAQETEQEFEREDLDGDLV